MTLQPELEKHLNWLIVEDSLENRKGHWFEYLGDFCRELPELGDPVTLLVSNRAEPFIRDQLKAEPILPESAFAKMSDGAPSLKRLARIPLHAWKTFFSLRKYLKRGKRADVIFVPTVIVHHLLGWVALIKFGIVPDDAKTLLFFPGLPIRKKNGAVLLDGSPTSKLQGFLFRMLAPEIRRGHVILGVETQAMKEAAVHAFGVPFTYFPHPVRPIESAPFDSPPPETFQGSANPQQVHQVTMACYGPARSEKGSDLLVHAIESYLERHPEGRARFVLQWLEDFTGPDGELVKLPEGLKNNPRVEIVDRFFEDGEYARRLSSTGVLLLPYRCSSYGLRVSRVVIESMVNGIPVVVTQGTTLAEQANEFGVFIASEDGDSNSLEKGIEEAEKSIASLGSRASDRMKIARDHFSVRHFREIILKN